MAVDIRELPAPSPLDTARLARTSRPIAAARRRRAQVAAARRRAATLAAVVVLAIAGLVLQSTAAESDVPDRTTSVVIAPGDTLWDIAVAATPAGQSPHATVAQILELNDVEAATLQPGATLTVPLN